MPAEQVLRSVMRGSPLGTYMAIAIHTVKKPGPQEL
jgi:hypothetical protein